MMRRALVSLALAALFSACSPAHRGMLEPIEDTGVTLVSTHGLPNDTARLTVGGITADVTGRWSDQGESVEIEYRAGPAPANVAVTPASTSTWDGKSAAASAAWDRSVDEPGNAIGRPLLDAGSLNLAANTRKLVQIEFARTGDGRPSIGDEVTIAIPMPGGVHAARFRVAGE